MIVTNTLVYTGNVTDRFRTGLISYSVHVRIWLKLCAATTIVLFRSIKIARGYTPTMLLFAKVVPFGFQVAFEQIFG